VVDLLGQQLLRAQVARDRAVPHEPLVRGGITALGGVNLVTGFVDLSLVFASRAPRDATDRPAA
jgi:hypothetical protein